MEAIVQLLSNAASEVRGNAPSAASVGLEPAELVQLGDRLQLMTTMAPDRIIVALRMLAGRFGDDRDAWRSISPAFVQLLDAVRNSV